MKNYYVGWDVGAFRCSSGHKDSCDSVVILDDHEIVGYCRENLTNSLHAVAENEEQSPATALLNYWANKTDANISFGVEDKVTVAIDTPLGWPVTFKNLLNGSLPSDWTFDSTKANITNPLLYRYTEREMLKGGLSVIVDSIGSQSVKGMALLNALQAKLKSWGIWHCDNKTFIETYPKACLVVPKFVDWMIEQSLNQKITQNFVGYKKNEVGARKKHTFQSLPEDLFDAAICACLAKAFSEKSFKMIEPDPNLADSYISEGWVFYPDPENEDLDLKSANGHFVSTVGKGVCTFDQAIREFKKFMNGQPI